MGGASFVGIVIAPWLIWLVNLAGPHGFGPALPVIPTLAAMSIAYALGEGLGRLACISFGCCYGKPLSDCSTGAQRLFARNHFIFTGETKKIAYAHNLGGREVIPVQTITAVISSLTGLAGCYLFLKGHPYAAFVLTLVVTQVWRMFSELLRADYRGGGKISHYQMLSAAALLYALPVGFWLKESSTGIPDLASGLGVLWNPALLLALAAIWIVTLIYTGKSKVTSAVIAFHVLKEKI